MATKWRWLSSTKELQENTYGYRFDPQHVNTFMTNYIQWNVFAAYQELAELSVEFAWKPWATDPPFVNRDRIRDEAIDILHFIGNILTAIGVTDDELAHFYQEKQAKNRRRAASGVYSARKGNLGEGSDVE
jgi:hypothetical protein